MDSKSDNKSFKSSTSAERIAKTANILNNSANIQIEQYHKQVQHNSILYKKLIKNLLTDTFDMSAAYDTSRDFLKRNEIGFVLLDK